MTDRLTEMLEHVANVSNPPVEQWNPAHCADMDLLITHNGDWVHEGRVMTRKKLVKLFASILKKEANEHFLVTPVEKVRISVENTPFIVVGAEQIGDLWFLTNNLDEVIELNSDCQLDVSDDQNPILFWRRNLTARISQSVMYQWQIHALDHDGFVDGKLYLSSGNDRFLIGQDN